MSHFVEFRPDHQEKVIRRCVTRCVKEELFSQANADKILAVLDEGEEGQKKRILNESFIAEEYPEWFARRVCSQLELTLNLPLPVVSERPSGDPDRGRSERSNKKETPIREEALVECADCGGKFKAGEIKRHREVCDEAEVVRTLQSLPSRTKKQRVECTHCGEKFKAGAGIARHEKACPRKRTGGGDLPKETPSETQQQHKKQKVSQDDAQESFTVTEDQASKIWEYTKLVYKEGGYEQFEALLTSRQVRPTLVTKIRQHVVYAASGTRLLAWFESHPKRERKKRFKGADRDGYSSDERDYELVDEPPNKKAPQKETKNNEHEEFQRDCLKLFRAHESRTGEAMKIQSSNGTTWITNDGPTPSERMLKYKWPLKYDTTGYVFCRIRKGGKANQYGVYRWFFIPPSLTMEEISKAANDHVRWALYEKKDPQIVSKSSLECLMSQYGEHGLTCKKRGAKHHSLCKGRPCERCWVALVRWYIDHLEGNEDSYEEGEETEEEGPLNDNFYIDAIRVGRDEYSADTKWNKEKYMADHKRKYGADFWKRYDKLQLELKKDQNFCISEKVLVQVFRQANDDESSFIYWPVDVCGYGYEGYNVAFRYGAPVTTDRSKWYIKTSIGDVKGLKKDKQYAHVKNLIPFDERFLDETEASLKKLGTFRLHLGNFETMKQQLLM